MTSAAAVEHLISDASPLVLLMLVLCALCRFAQLEEKAIISLASALKPFQAMKGDIIYNEGDVGTEMYILLSGEVELSSSQVSPNAQLRPRQLNWKSITCWHRSCRRLCTRATC